jgi:predicted pyridoxine 5'-phosphate oxidase superfamily flavin-nucleotide-binding protein
VVATGFHSGELAVQHAAGVTADAARLVRMLEQPNLDGGARRFLADRTLAAISARNARGVFWTSPLVGPAGFLDAHGTTLDVLVTPRHGDPLAGIPIGQPVGMIAIDFATRRRLRINGTLTGAGIGQLTISVDQAYGNCPQYIQPRIIEPTTAARTHRQPALDSIELTVAQVGLIHCADTFFLGTTHPTRGSDTSHRGGPAGFVRVESGALWWPDYPGNNMFNSLGNLAVDPTAGLLFIDFSTGRTLHLTGAAELEWVEPGTSGDDDHTGRRVRFTVQRIILPDDPLSIDVRGSASCLGQPAATR